MLFQLVWQALAWFATDRANYDPSRWGARNVSVQLYVVVVS